MLILFTIGWLRLACEEAIPLSFIHSVAFCIWMRECSVSDSLAVALDTIVPDVLQMREATNKFGLVARPDPQ